MHVHRLRDGPTGEAMMHRVITSPANTDVITHDASRRDFNLFYAKLFDMFARATETFLFHGKPIAKFRQYLLVHFSDDACLWPSGHAVTQGTEHPGGTGNEVLAPCTCQVKRTWAQPDLFSASADLGRKLVVRNRTASLASAITRLTS